MRQITDLERSKFIHDEATISDPSVVRVALSNRFAPEQYDEIAVTYPSATSEVYTYKLESASVGVITVTYTDSTKENISSVLRS